MYSNGNDITLFDKYNMTLHQKIKSYGDQMSSLKQNNTCSQYNTCSGIKQEKYLAYNTIQNHDKSLIALLTMGQAHLAFEKTYDEYTVYL